MSIHDPLIHPALLDPRQWADVNLYEPSPPLEREPLCGPEHHTPDRRFELKHLRLELRFDDEQESISGSATITLAPFADGFTHFELDAAEMNVSSVRLAQMEPREKAASATVGESEIEEPLLGAASVPLVFETFKEKIAVELDRAYARGEQLTVEI